MVREEVLSIVLIAENYDVLLLRSGHDCRVARGHESCKDFTRVYVVERNRDLVLLSYAEGAVIGGGAEVLFEVNVMVVTLEKAVDFVVKTVFRLY